MAQQTSSLCRTVCSLAGLLASLMCLPGCEDKSAAKLSVVREEVDSIGGSVTEFDDGMLSVSLQRCDLSQLSWQQVFPLAKLQSISLTGSNFSDAEVRYLANSPDLEFIQCDFTQITDTGVSELRDLSSLTYLDLSGCPITDACIPDLLAITSLEELVLLETHISEEGAKKLAQQFSLRWSLVPSEVIRLTLLQLVRDDIAITIDSNALAEGADAPPQYFVSAESFERLPAIEKPELLFEHLARLGGVGEVYLPLEPAQLVYLRPMSRIHNLDISEPSKVSSSFDAQQWSHLAKLYIERLSLTFINELPSEALQVLPKIKELEVLEVWDQTITPEDWAQLVQCPQLKRLNLVGCKLQDIQEFKPTPRPLELRLEGSDLPTDKDQTKLKELTRTSKLSDLE